MSGIYIHIPFCASRCIYCGFYSTTLSHLRGRYVDALCREMEMRSSEIASSPVRTIYLGGGTPSLLKDEEVSEIFLYINNVYSPEWDKVEVTIECNPDDITPEYCQTISALPVNRVSMGAQTFSDERLKFLHRRHKAGEVARAVTLLRSAGIKNISVDLMFAFPGETLSDWQDDIEKALELDVEHISAYSLQYEEGTQLYGMLQRHEIEEIDDELYRQMYNLLCDMLESEGYEHYEISNFAKPGFRSRHNSSYWHDVPYIGFGAAAHSFSGSIRSWNVDNLTQYISSIEHGILPSESESVDDDTHYDDTVMTALRTAEGLSLDNLQPQYRQYLLKSASPYISSGDMRIDHGRLCLTRNGIFISDLIMSDLMIG